MIKAGQNRNNRKRDMTFVLINGNSNKKERDCAINYITSESNQPWFELVIFVTHQLKMAYGRIEHSSLPNSSVKGKRQVFKSLQ